MIRYNNPARPIAWLILVLGIAAIALAVIQESTNLELILQGQPTGTFLSFSLTQIFWAGVVYGVVGIILLLILRPITVNARQEMPHATQASTRR